MSLRGCGLIPDLEADVEQDNARRHVGVLLGAAPQVLPVEASYRAWLDQILNQGGTSACVGCAISTAVYLRMRHQIGEKARRPSPRGIYDVARLIDRPHLELLDLGCRPRAAMIGVQEHGMTLDERWPLREDNINVPPPFDVFVAGAGALLTGWYRADSGDVVAMLQHALFAGQFPVFGMYVPQSFYGWTGDAIFDADGEPSPALGAHMQAICGFGPGYFEVVSSWGEGHGNRGIVRVSDRFLASRWCFDRLVVTAVPAVLT